MSVFLSVSITLPAVLLLGVILIPSGVARIRSLSVGRLVTALAAIQCIVACCFALAMATGLIHSFQSQWSALLGVHYDGISALMYALVSFVGWVICRYSIRYLDGETTQGRFFCWTGFTIGAVSLMVVSGNLLLFFACWVMTSLGLHQLLLHYGQRSAAQQAAWTKFAISRVGDAALVAAIVLIYREFRTLNFSEVFAAVDAVKVATPAMSAASVLLIVGAITKSAQFPFHTWLPLTMETPTSVSALMHAGIVNAGGYLVIRTSPILQLVPWALTLLVVVGTVTACYGAVVMLTQTSVKRSLAYSTIAQMGFMMLQCGLGAYSAAMLHILAHSLYKAHAFLRTGSVISDRATTDVEMPNQRSVPAIQLASVGLFLASILFTSMAIFGFDVTSKPGGLLLGSVLCLGLTYSVWLAMRTGDRYLIKRSLATSCGLCVVYVLAFVAVDSMMPTQPSRAMLGTAWLGWCVVAATFLGMCLLQVRLASGHRSPRLARWYVHASNGFYVHSHFRRLFGHLAQS